MIDMGSIDDFGTNVPDKLKPGFIFSPYIPLYSTPPSIFEDLRDSEWFAPAGFDRGLLKNLGIE